MVETLLNLRPSREYSRIHFIPDMFPGDVTGTQIFNPKEGSFSVRPGPVFANIVLAGRDIPVPLYQAVLLIPCRKSRSLWGLNPCCRAFSGARNAKPH